MWTICVRQRTNLIQFDHIWLRLFIQYIIIHSCSSLFIHYIIHSKHQWRDWKFSRTSVFWYTDSLKLLKTGEMVWRPIVRARNKLSGHDFLFEILYRPDLVPARQPQKAGTRERHRSSFAHPPRPAWVELGRKVISPYIRETHPCRLASSLLYHTSIRISVFISMIRRTEEKSDHDLISKTLTQVSYLTMKSHLAFIFFRMIFFLLSLLTNYRNGSCVHRQASCLTVQGCVLWS